MKWRKLGRIFDPTEYQLPNNCMEFAQSPQALVFEDFVRIFFSTRQKDDIDKYLSHVVFVDFEKNFKNIINISTQTVLDLGKLGCFDEHGIFPLNVLRVGKRVYGYIGGWSRRVSVSVDGSIGLAISTDDGMSFTRIGDGPVLTASLAEPFLVGDPFVSKIDDVFHMWYIYGVGWIDNENKTSKERIYKIGHARSNDGIVWDKTGGRLISDKLDVNECQALPTVVDINDKYHMLFCYRPAIGFRNKKGSGYRIGYASSRDLSHWTRDDNSAGIEISNNGWDSEMLCYPHMFKCDDKIYLLYNGNEFGRFGFGLAVLEDI